MIYSHTRDRNEEDIIVCLQYRKQGGEERRVSRMREKKGNGQLEGRGWSQGGVFIHIQYGRAGRKEGRGGREGKIRLWKEIKGRWRERWRRGRREDRGEEVQVCERYGGGGEGRDQVCERDEESGGGGVCGGGEVTREI